MTSVERHAKYVGRDLLIYNVLDTGEERIKGGCVKLMIIEDGTSTSTSRCMDTIGTIVFLH